jgi:predicted metal-dependent hydrolase
VNEIERVEKLRGIRRPKQRSVGSVLYRGEPTPVRIEEVHRGGANRVVFDSGQLIVLRSSKSKTLPATTLENWLRKQARSEIVRYLNVITAKLKRQPAKILIMGQRTKWGNCSPMRNLSFNWRLIMAPDFVLHYLVTHEAVHLAVPDHSHKFWLTVRSHCRDTERARQWLCANGHRLLVDLADVCAA